MSLQGTSAARRRLIVVCLVLLIVGSPWVLRLPIDHAPFWVIDQLFPVEWQVSSDGLLGGTAQLVASDVSTALLLAAILFFLPSQVAKTRGWLRCLVVGVLVTEATGLVYFLLEWTFGAPQDSEPTLRPGDFLIEILRDSIAFGVVLGVVLFVVLSTAPKARRPKERKPTVAEPALGPIGSVPGDVTRYLCAAAYLDERFADLVVDQVLADEAGLIAPSVGVDLVPVAHHCLAARDRRHERDLRLAAVAGIMALVSPLWLALAALFLTAAARLAPQAGDGQTWRGRRAQVNTSHLVRIIVGVALLVLIWITVDVTLSSELPLPGFFQWLFGTYLHGIPAGVVMLAVATLVYRDVARHELAVDQSLRTTMRRESFSAESLPVPSADRPEWIAERLAAVADAQAGNVTVYSGYNPFVGFGGTTSQWSLAVPLLPATDVGSVLSRPTGFTPFTIPDLVDHIRHQLRHVLTSQELPSLIVEDRVFTNGATLAEDRFTWDTALIPAQLLPPDKVMDIMANPTGTARHYLATHVPLWGGDVVPSVFLHFAVDGQTLHLHCDNHTLGPVAAGYHVVDRMSQDLTPERRTQLFASTVLSRASGAFVNAPRRVLRHFRYETRHAQRMDYQLDAIDQDPAFDFGAWLSIRELALSPNYQNYFQVIDARRIIAAVERHTLATICEFLDARGFDTTDFRNQQQTILNQGVIQQGGLSFVGNQAVGAGSTATQNGSPAADTLSSNAAPTSKGS